LQYARQRQKRRDEDKRPQLDLRLINPLRLARAPAGRKYYVIVQIPEGESIYSGGLPVVNLSL